MTDRYRCRFCPAFDEIHNPNGEAMRRAIVDEQGKQKIVQDVTQFAKHPDGQFITRGWCRLSPGSSVVFANDIHTFMPQKWSDEWCEHPDRPDKQAARAGGPGRETLYGRSRSRGAA